MSTLSEDVLVSPVDGARLAAVRAKPAGARRGGVVVIQEIFGLSEHIREICTFFADAGYEAYAPSMFDRIEPNFSAGLDADGFAKGARAAGSLTPAHMTGDMQAAIEALGAGPIFMTGFCFGGAMCWLAGARCSGLAAVSGFYGGALVRMLDAPPRVPAMFHYGRLDGHIPMSDVDKARAAAPDAIIHVYDDAGHGFCRKASADFHAPSRDLALSRTLDFFAQHG
jgi:carboxymethylenebutenolidase